MQTKTQTNAPLETVVNQPVKEIEIARFSGQNAAFQRGCYFDLCYAGLSQKQAHLIASDFGSDLGNMLANADKAGQSMAAKIGKAKKNGESRINIAGGAYVKTSPAMSLLRVAQQVDSMFREGLLIDREVDTATLSKGLNKYLESVNERVQKNLFIAPKV